jgi:hypothetical protein
VSIGAEDPLSGLLEQAFGQRQRLLGDPHRLSGGHQLPVGLLDVGEQLDDLDLETDPGLVADVLGNDDLGPGDGGAEAVEQRLGEAEPQRGVKARVEEEEGRVGLSAQCRPVGGELGAARQQLVNADPESRVAAFRHVGALEDGGGWGGGGVAVDVGGQERVEDPARAAHVGIGDGDIVAAHLEAEVARECQLVGAREVELEDIAG